jgi:hypothetical protein
MIPLTSITHPGNPAWNCCKAKPAKVVSFDDGSAIVACLGCSQTVGSSRRHDLPEGWTPTTANDALKLVADAARRAHFEIATHDDLAIASGSSEIYQSSQALFKAAIKAAYPGDDVEAMYEAWLDCFEDLDHCATVVRQRKAAEIDEITNLLHPLDR